MENNEREPKLTYTEIPEDIALIICGGKSFTLLNVDDCSLFDVLTKILCYTKEYAKKNGVGFAHAFQDTILMTYKYMDGWWKNKPAEINFRRVYTSIRNILLNKEQGTIDIGFVLYANEYYKGVHEGESIDKEFLKNLIEQLKQEEEHETQIIKETDKIINRINRMMFDSTIVRNLDPIKERFRIDGKDECLIVDIALYCYGYIEGKKAERAKREGAVKWN